MTLCLPRSNNFLVWASALTLSVALALPSDAFARRLLDRSVATVNNEVVLESDIDAFLKKTRSRSFQELFGGLDPKALQSRTSVLNLLIEERILDQQIKKLELGATDQEVDAQVRVILKRNGITENQLKERLKQLGTPYKDYQNGIRRQIERRNLVDREIRPSIELSDESLRRYYQNKVAAQDGNNSEKEYKIAHLLIEGTSAESKKRAEQISTQLQANPGSFAEVVKETSDDTSTSDKSGLLGYFSSSALSQEFRKVIPKTAPGSITAPIQTASGFHIIKVLDTRLSGFDSLPKEQKEALRNQMMGEELERRMTSWLERKRTDSYITRAEGADQKRSVLKDL